MDSGLLPGLLPGLNEAERTCLLLALARLVGLLLAAPLYSSRLLPLKFRAGFALAIILCFFLSSPFWRQFWSRAPGGVAFYSSGPSGQLLAAGGELLVGLSLGWGALLALGAVRGAAVFISDQVGLSLGGVMDPLAEQSEPTLSGFHAALALFIFVTLDLHHLFLRLVVESFVTLPPGTLAAGKALPAMGSFLLSMVAGLFQAAVLMAFPVTLMLLLVSVAQGVLTRALPEMELFILGFPLRVLVGLGVVVLALPFTARIVQDLMERAASDGTLFLRRLAG